MRISDWSSVVCSSELKLHPDPRAEADARDPCRLRFGVEALHPIERAGRVGKLADAVVERALALADAAEIEPQRGERSEEHTSELQSLMRISYAVFCLKKKK